MGAQRSIAKGFPQKLVLRVFHHLFLSVSVYILVIKLFEEGTVKLFSFSFHACRKKYYLVAKLLTDKCSF